MSETTWPSFEAAGDDLKVGDRVRLDDDGEEFATITAITRLDDGMIKSFTWVEP